MGERYARDVKSGERFTLPKDTTYEQWKKMQDEKYGAGTVDKMRKMEYNKKADMAQFERYREQLGADAPKTFEEFQTLKYDGPAKWAEVKRQYRSLNNFKADSGELAESKSVQPDNAFKNAILEKLRGYSVSMNSYNQSKHIRGESNFDPTRGELTVNPQVLYARYSGKGQFLITNAGDWNSKERFVHSTDIGVYRSKYTGEETLTNAGIIHYSKRKGWHIVPARPQKGTQND